MKTKQEERYEELTKLIDSYTDKNHITPAGFLIPFEKSVVIKKSGNTDALVTDGGIMLVEGAANNSVIPNIGVVYAVGPKCSEHIQVGQKVAWNQFSNLEIMIKGVVYMMISEMDVYGCLPSDTYVRIDPKSDKEIIREEGIDREKGYRVRKHKDDENKKDRGIILP